MPTPYSYQTKAMATTRGQEMMTMGQNAKLLLMHYKFDGLDAVVDDNNEKIVYGILDKNLGEIIADLLNAYEYVFAERDELRAKLEQARSCIITNQEAEESELQCDTCGTTVLRGEIHYYHNDNGEVLFACAQCIGSGNRTATVVKMIMAHKEGGGSSETQTDST